MEVPWLCLGSLVCDFKSGVLQVSDRKEQFTGLAVKFVLLLTDYSPYLEKKRFKTAGTSVTCVKSPGCVYLISLETEFPFFGVSGGETVQRWHSSPGAGLYACQV